MTGVNHSALTFTWQFSDSSGKVFTDNEVSVYRNSIGIQTSLMSRNTRYTIYVEATDGVRRGNAS